MEGLAQQLLATKSPRCTKKRSQPGISLNKPNNGMLDEEPFQRQATLATLHGAHKQQADVHTAPRRQGCVGSPQPPWPPTAHCKRKSAAQTVHPPSRVGQKAYTSVCTPAPCACLPCRQANSCPSTPPSQHMQVHGIRPMHLTVCTGCLQDRLQPMNPHPASSPPFPIPPHGETRQWAHHNPRPQEAANAAAGTGSWCRCASQHPCPGSR